MGSTYGILIPTFTYIYHSNQPNVGKYTSPMDRMGTSSALKEWFNIATMESNETIHQTFWRSRQHRDVPSWWSQKKTIFLQPKQGSFGFQLDRSLPESLSFNYTNLFFPGILNPSSVPLHSPHRREISPPPAFWWCSIPLSRKKSSRIGNHYQNNKRHKTLPLLGCPRKLGSMVSKWIIIYKWCILGVWPTYYS